MYPADFEREIVPLWIHGLSRSSSLEVKPAAPALIGEAETFGDFSYQADGRYSSFVRHAALVFVTVISAAHGMTLPDWLSGDLCAIQASFVYHSAKAERVAVIHPSQIGMHSKPGESSLSSMLNPLG